jgi:hypothetical protein
MHPGMEVQLAAVLLICSKVSCDGTSMRPGDAPAYLPDGDRFNHPLPLPPVAHFCGVACDVPRLPSNGGMMMLPLSGDRFREHRGAIWLRAGADGMFDKARSIHLADAGGFAMDRSCSGACGELARPPPRGPPCNSGLKN